MLEPKEMAMEIVVNVGRMTMFDKNFNDGMSLPFHVAKKMSTYMVSFLVKEEEMWQNGQVNPNRYWKSVYEELIKLEL